MLSLSRRTSSQKRLPKPHAAHHIKASEDPIYGTSQKGVVFQKSMHTIYVELLYQEEKNSWVLDKQ